MRVLFILQNAWSRAYAGGEWPRRSWLRALHTSRSGERLRVITDQVRSICIGCRIPHDAYEFDYNNTTPIVGNSPKSVVKPDRKHMELVIMRGCVPGGNNQLTVVACGKQAAKAVKEVWSGHTIIVPHPTYRVLTNDLYKLAARFIVTDDSGTVELKQGKGETIVKHHE
jgi:hypothetical protein